MDLSRSHTIRTIFKLREVALTCSLGKARCKEDSLKEGSLPKQFAAQMKAIGCAVLAENPGHEIVFGAVTQPWLANPVFESIRPEEFANFKEVGYVKIAWTLRTDAVSPPECTARIQTRATTTDAVARAQFRRCWSLALPGILLIRRVLLRKVKREAKRRMRETKTEYEAAEFGQYV
jgi:hypothetical protein